MTKLTALTPAFKTEMLQFDDELDTVKHLVEAAFCAGRYAMQGSPDGRPFDIAAMVAGDRLRDLSDKFGKLRKKHLDEPTHPVRRRKRARPFENGTVIRFPVPDGKSSKET